METSFQRGGFESDEDASFAVVASCYHAAFQAALVVHCFVLAYEVVSCLSEGVVVVVDLVGQAVDHLGT